MSHEVIVEFIGFDAGAHVRVYKPSAERHDFTLTISNKVLVTPNQLSGRT
jgi:hypothetical protein